MSLTDNAARNPNKVATLMADTGEALTYRELNEHSQRLAQYFRAAGLQEGDVVALFMENNIRYHEVFWAAVRSGMYLCAVSRHLTADEAAYIINDSGAKAIVTSTALAGTAAELIGLIDDCQVRLCVDGTLDGYDDYFEAVAGCEAAPLESEIRGDFMNYSSGTTGRPKGVKRPLPGLSFDENAPLDGLLGQLFGLDESTVYLSTAPLYHSAPMAFTTAVHSLGGTNVIMGRFDAVDALRFIEEHQITHSQFVPTMFVRMLKLPPEARSRFDLSSHQMAIHAAAPCPVDVKRQMLDWWGPIIHEYYGGTEINGLTVCNSEEWLAHPGTVGRPVLGIIHICDEAGVEVPTGERGIVYFERDAMPFEYHNDPAKTEAARHPDHRLWTKLGDVGYVDDDGYLHLTDRESFMIISGGVNIYPQEIEDALVMHPKIADVAVFGVPNDDLGEEVKAAIELADGIDASPEVAEEILAFARDNLARFKVPRSIDFEDELPRLDTGKLYKRKLRALYWPA